MVRSYDSQGRAQQARRNRERVVAVATEMFCDLGWSATTLSAVAGASGVTRQTIYQQFPNKLALLDTCIGTALGDGQDVPVRDTDAYRLMGVGDDLEERLTAAARWLSDAHERSAEIQNVLDQAAVTDPEASHLLVIREQRRRDEVAWATGLVAREAVAEAVVDDVWLLASRRNWLVLVSGRGWTPEQWRRWFIGHVHATLVMSAVS
ncbi:MULTISPECIES: TetR/AcrR family transcriptional regulator [unclassified Gordonia (in: high G+C Gram-positive bacteria)]